MQAQLLLAGLRHQKVPECPEAFPLIRIGDGITLTHDLLQQHPSGRVVLTEQVQGGVVESQKGVALIVVERAPPDAGWFWGGS
ncbi:MAG: hypothetical protein WCG61_03330 [Chlorobium sp.]